MLCCKSNKMFQFHKGPIKAAAGINPYNAVNSFQFHKGPIKAYPRYKVVRL